MTHLQIPWSSMWSHLFSGVFWFEVWVHFVFVCSAASFALAPYEEWAKENLPPDQFKRIHSRIALIQKYGALNKRSNLGGVNIADLQPPADDTKADAAGAGKP